MTRFYLQLFSDGCAHYKLWTYTLLSPCDHKALSTLAAIGLAGNGDNLSPNSATRIRRL